MAWMAVLASYFLPVALLSVFILLDCAHTAAGPRLVRVTPHRLGSHPAARRRQSIGIRRCGERRQAQGKETADGNDSEI